MTETTTAAPESQPFQAEVAELLNLMVHSVYSETDIFPARIDLERIRMPATSCAMRRYRRLN